MCEESLPADRVELQALLDELICRANENGVEVADHGYVLRHRDSELPDWDVEITRMSE